MQSRFALAFAAFNQIAYTGNSRLVGVANDSLFVGGGQPSREM